MLKENKVYLLTKHEFLLLAAAAGIQRLYGFDMNAGALEQEAAVYVLQDLTQRNYLQAIDGKFVLSEEMAGLFECIKGAETTMDVHKSSGRSCIIYMGRISVKVSQSMRRKDTFEVMSIPITEVWDYLQEEGWIPEELDSIELE